MAKKYISADELAGHSSPGDLWISIDGKIYDVSSWLPSHPGGDLPLLSLSGRDATDAFLAYHPPHASSQLRRFHNGLHLQGYSVSPLSRDYRSLLHDLTQSNLFHAKGRTVSLSLAAIAALLSLCVYGVVACRGPLLHALCGAAMGFLWIQSGWLGHDSGHYNIMRSRPQNRFIQILSGNCLAGISIAWWKRNHNAHHIAVNSLDHDPDLQHLPFFAVSSKFFASITSLYYNRKLQFDSAARFLVSHQHWTYYPVMTLARFNLFAQSFFLLSSNKKVPNRAQELLGLLVFWIWYPLLVSFLPNWGERVLFVICSFVVTSIQHVQFTLNHFSANVYIGLPNGNDWFEKQTMGTLNISCPPWMDWFHGGLQFQIEHHLFPRLPRRQLRAVAPAVRDLCKKHGLPYNCAGFWEANLMTLRTLKAAAMQARDYSKPPPRNLVWEAVNTFG